MASAPLREEINSTVPDESHFLFIDPKRRRCSPAAHVSERFAETADAHPRGACVFLLFTSCQGLKLTKAMFFSLHLTALVPSRGSEVTGEAFVAACSSTGREVDISEVSLQQITGDT